MEQLRKEAECNRVLQETAGYWRYTASEKGKWSYMDYSIIIACKVSLAVLVVCYAYASIILRTVYCRQEYEVARTHCYVRYLVSAGLPSTNEGGNILSFFEGDKPHDIVSSAVSYFFSSQHHTPTCLVSNFSPLPPPMSTYSYFPSSSEH